MDAKAKELVKGWVAADGDRERTARWMSRVLRLGSLRECRELVSEALA